MDCSVCGSPGASYCRASDEFGNPAGDYVHPTCFARVNTIELENCKLSGSYSSQRVSRAGRMAMPKMWSQGRQVRNSVSRFWRMQGLPAVRRGTKVTKT